MKIHQLKIFLILLAGGFCATPSSAQIIDTRLPIEVDADSTDANARTGQVAFSNIRIQQGQMSIAANLAESSSLDFENSTWIFKGNVQIKSLANVISASEFTLVFKNKRVDRALVSGTPLTFQTNNENSIEVFATTAEVIFFNDTVSSINLVGLPIQLKQSSALTGAITLAEADTIEYDAQSNNLKLVGNAKLSEEGNQITGNQILYNLSNQRVLAAANEAGDGRVRITIKPSEESLPTEMPKLGEEILDKP